MLSYEDNKQKHVYKTITIEKRKESFMKEKWLGWAVSESFIRVISNALQKTIGDLMKTAGPVFYGTAVMGLTQAILGFIGVKATKQKIIAECEKADYFGVKRTVIDRRGIIGSTFFGAIAVACITLSFLVFSYGGKLILHVFIVTLGIIPGAFIDRIFFGYKLTKLQVLGILIAIMAGYSALGAPSLYELTHLPIWMLFSFLTMLGMAINQGITQKIQNINPLVKNFWGGITIFVLAGIIGIIFGSINPVSAYPVKIATVSAEIGVLFVLLWTVNLYAYKGGAFIVIKKLVVNAGYIILGALWGTAFFKESLSLLHILGFVLYCIAFILVDKKTWQLIKSKLGNKSPINN